MYYLLHTLTYKVPKPDRQPPYDKITLEAGTELHPIIHTVTTVTPGPYGNQDDFASLCMTKQGHVVAIGHECLTATPTDIHILRIGEDVHAYCSPRCRDDALQGLGADPVPSAYVEQIGDWGGEYTCEHCNTVIVARQLRP